MCASVCGRSLLFRQHKLPVIDLVVQRHGRVGLRQGHVQAGLLDDDGQRRGRRSIFAKISQSTAALRLEGFWSKRQIIEAYLNLVSFRGELVGVFSDGDLRRSMEKGFDLLNRPVSELMNRQPKRIVRTQLAAKAVQTMEQFSITSLFVFETEESYVPVGIIHLHDLLKAGVV